MAELNFKLKDGIEPSALLKYGFVPKYDEDTGEVKEYRKTIHIEGKQPDEKHFTFVFYTEHRWGGFFRRSFYYETWMSCFRWNSLCEKEAVQLFYDLIIDGIIEPTDLP